MGSAVLPAGWIGVRRALPEPGAGPGGVVGVARGRIARRRRGGDARPDVLRRSRRPLPRLHRRGARLRGRRRRDRRARCRCTRRTRTAPASPTSCSPRCRPSSPSTSPRCGRRRSAPRVPIDADVFHLHHLTPQLDAAHRHWPDVPLVVHLHGTELKLIEAIEQRVALAATLGETLATMPRRGGRRRSTSARDLDAGAGRAAARRPAGTSWRHGEFWAAHLKQQAQLADHLITVSPAEPRRPRSRCSGSSPSDVTALPNGVDIERFRPRPRSPGARRAAFRRVPRRRPAGLDASPGRPERCAYTEADLDRLLGAGRRRHRAALRRAVPRVQARARADPRVRPRARAGSPGRARS